MPLLYLRLRDSAAWPRLPGDVQGALTAAFRAAATRTLLQEAALAGLTASLTSAGVRVALLKGAATGRTVYDSPAERPVSDFDLLVPRDQVEAARAVLVDLGFRELNLPQRGPLGKRLRRFRAELPFAGTGPQYAGLLVELHWALLEMPYYIHRIPMTEVWDAAEPVEPSGAWRPDPATLLVHAAAHLALHHSRDLRLIWLLDIDRLAASPALDWHKVVRLADEWNLALAVQTTLDVAARWLGTPVPPEVIAGLQRRADDPAGRALWGLGDERRGRAWRRAVTTLAVLPPRAKLAYAGWLALRTAVAAGEALRGALHPGGGPVRAPSPNIRPGVPPDSAPARADAPALPELISVWLPLLREALQRDGQFRFPLRGSSMRPTLPETCDIVIVPLPSRPRLGSLLVFAQRDALVAHRLVRRTRDRWIAQGDGRWVSDPALLPAQVLGLVSAAYAGDRRIWPGRLERAAAWFWVARHYALSAAMRPLRMAARQLRRWR